MASPGHSSANTEGLGQAGHCQWLLKGLLEMSLAGLGLTPNLSTLFSLSNPSPTFQTPPEEMPGWHHEHQLREETASQPMQADGQREGEACLTCAHASIIGKGAKEAQVAEPATKGRARQGEPAGHGQAGTAEPAASTAAAMLHQLG